MIDKAGFLVSVLLFCIGIYLIVDLFVSGFDLFVLVGAIGCLILAHYSKPGGRRNEDASFLDILEFVIDIPFKTIAAALRLLGKPFKGDVDGIDFDM